MSDAPLADSLSLLPADASAAPQAASVDASSSASTGPRLSVTSAPEKSGWMELLDSDNYSDDSQPIFNQYWFVLSQNDIQYFVNQESTTVKGVIQLEGCSAEIVPESKYQKSACFELNSPVQGRLFGLACESSEEMQGWINAIRSSMLKIRRRKAKEAQNKKRAAVEGAAQESQAAQLAHREQQQAMANAALASTTAPPASYSYATPSSLHSAPSHPIETHTSSHASSMPSSASSHPHSGYAPPSDAYDQSPSNGAQSSEDKYSVYRMWLEETKAGRKSSTARNGPGGGELHAGLLNEQEKKSTFEKLCGCCPAWCFR